MFASPNYTVTPDRYTERSALITGGARGLGYAVAQRLVAEGATVGLVDLDEDAVESAAERLRGSGSTVLTYVADVTDETAAHRIVDEFAERAGSIDVLVTMAGIFPFAEFADTTPEMWRRVVDINLGGTYNFAHAAFPHMKQKEYGRIVTVSSGTFLLGMPGLSAYVASKGGVLGLTRVLAREGGSHGITTNSVLPGFMATEAALNLPLDDVDGYIAGIVAAQALPRRGEPEDIADAVAYLASEGAQFVTGQSLYVGGGDRFI